MTDERIFIPMPGTGVTIDYADQRERDQSARLAESRQGIGERAGFAPAWSELSEKERENAILEARNWLRAAAEAGLLEGR
jgi:hypothetical protein